MRRAMWGLGGASFVLLAVYMLASVGDLPARVPMQFDAHNDPTWFASRATFYVWMLVLWLGLNALLLALRPREALAFVFAVVNVVSLLIFHVIYQNATDGDLLRLSANGLIVILAPVWAGIIVFAVYYKLTQRRQSL